MRKTIRVTPGCCALLRTGCAKKRRPRYASGGERGLICSMAKIGFNKNRDEMRKFCITGYYFRRTSAKHLLVCVPAYVHICIFCVVSACICPMPKTYHEDKKEKQQG